MYSLLAGRREAGDWPVNSILGKLICACKLRDVDGRSARRHGGHCGELRALQLLLRVQTLPAQQVRHLRPQRGDPHLREPLPKQKVLSALLPFPLRIRLRPSFVLVIDRNLLPAMQQEGTRASWTAFKVQRLPPQKGAHR